MIRVVTCVRAACGLCLPWLVLALLLACLRPMAIPDEGRYGEIGRWMWLSGDWLAPRLDGIPFFHKPPLLYWLEAMSVGVLGPRVWAVRLVPLLHAALMLIGLYTVTRLWAGDVLARRAALMLGSSLAFLVGGQYVNHDMLVACWISLAIVFFGWSFASGEVPHAGWARAGFVACGLGILCKGLIGLALPGLVLLLWLSWTRQWGKIVRLPWLSGLALFALITVPWFVLAERNYPGMLGYLFGTHQFGRFTATTFNNARPWWFYGVAVVVLWGLWLPWTLVSGWQALRGQAVQREATPEASPSEEQLTRLRSLAWIWLLAILGFFSIPNSKLLGYALPVVPALAVLSSLGWSSLRGWRQERWLWRSLLALGAALAVGANHYAGQFIDKFSSRDVAQALACLAHPDAPLHVLGGYPYDLPFLSQRTAPLRVMQDWAALQGKVGDEWRSELLDGARFDAQAAQVLVPLDTLPALASQPGQWLVVAHTALPEMALSLQAFESSVEGRNWSLYRSPGTPEAAGCTP
jgi:4-amino-4-deoxy-L-arabinose transferase-like glycosyltransferase